MAGLKVVTSPPKAAVDIVLVHGWCDGRQPWTYGSGDSSIFWPEKLLPAVTPGARILTFEYDTDGFWPVNAETPLEGISDDLFEELISQRFETETTARPIIFVAHSIGGLVLETGLLRSIDGANERRELAGYIRRVALLGTPYRGIDKTSWAETAVNFLKLTRMANVPLPETLAGMLGKFTLLGEKLPALLELRSRTPETRLEMACFYEGLPTALGHNSITIAAESAVRIPGCPPPQSLDAKHQSMGEFQGKDDPNFRRVARQLSRWAKDLEKTSSNRPQTVYTATSTFSGNGNRGVQVGMNPGTLIWNTSGSGLS